METVIGGVVLILVVFLIGVALLRWVLRINDIVKELENANRTHVHVSGQLTAISVQLAEINRLMAVQYQSRVG